MSQQKIILIVDDNPQLIDGVKLTLEMEGFQVLTASTGQEALTVLERITPDLILADIMMPELDGYQLYEAVHAEERWVQVPFVFLTAKTSSADIRRGKEMGADDYLTKPFAVDDLVAAVRGRLKRAAELTGRPVVTDVVGNLKYAWHGKLGPAPVPFVVLAAVVAIALMGAVPFSLWGAPSAVELGLVEPPLREDAGEMVLVPAGDILVSDIGGVAGQMVYVPTFQLDKYEVTNALFKTFVAETGYPAPWGSYPAEQANHPVVNVSWEAVNGFCIWAGKRLPTETEWQKAAYGSTGLTYPWGNEWQPGMANTREAGTFGPEPVGSYSAGVSPYGIHDLAGNVWEWGSDWTGADEQAKVIRGGAWNAVNTWAAASARNSAPPVSAQPNLGFRCAR